VSVLRGWSAPDRGQERLRREFLALLATGPTAVLPDGPGPHLTASALVVDPVRGKVLLCLHGRIGKWLQMGGHVEPTDATLRGAALREATEESGIAGLVISDAPIGLDVHPVRCRHGESSHWDVRYAVLAPSGAVESCSAESRALDWFDPDALPQPLGDATDSLVAPALAWARFAVAGADG
jgi:8-oxo-dGTP pyrophosphatase MutT (NUDIX family)